MKRPTGSHVEGIFPEGGTVWGGDADLGASREEVKSLGHPWKELPSSRPIPVHFWML